jgi:hypothetical protein
VLLPWLRDQILPTVDPENAYECHAIAGLVKELQDLCSARVTKGITTAFVTHLERFIPEQALKVCLPLLKLGTAARGSEEHKGGDSAAGSADFARAFTIHQLQRLTRVLDCGCVMRTNRLFRAEAAAKCGWKALTEQALPSAMKLMRVGTIEVRVALCSAWRRTT